jgi:hypothetical protein
MRTNCGFLALKITTCSIAVKSKATISLLNTHVRLLTPLSVRPRKDIDGFVWIF